MMNTFGEMSSSHFLISILPKGKMNDIHSRHLLLNFRSVSSLTHCVSVWISYSIQVGPKSNSKQLHCLCTHLSAFGGDFFVAPNPIDFDKVFAAFGSLAETGNFVVLSTVCALLGLYVIGLILARREDKRDELRVRKPTGVLIFIGKIAIEVYIFSYMFHIC